MEERLEIVETWQSLASGLTKAELTIAVSLSGYIMEKQGYFITSWCDSSAINVFPV
jgi:hypothetical protein